MSSPAPKRSIIPALVLVGGVGLVSGLPITMANSGDRVPEPPTFRDDRPVIAEAAAPEATTSRSALSDAVVAQVPAESRTETPAVDTPAPPLGSSEPRSAPLLPVTDADTVKAEPSPVQPVVLDPLVSEPAPAANIGNTPVIGSPMPTVGPVVEPVETAPAATTTERAPLAETPSPHPMLPDVPAPIPTKPDPVEAAPPAAHSTPALATPFPAAPVPAASAAVGLPAGKASAMVHRAEKLLAIGDIAGARLFLERGLARGDGVAALLLGSTYDPVWLSERGVHSVAANAEKARAYYVKARELGVATAPVRP